MAAAIAILRELHRLRRHIKGLQEEIERTPLLLKARQEALVRQEQSGKDAHDRLNKLKVDLRQSESTLRQTHQQIAKWEGQLREIASKKEYDALQHEIAAARAKCSQLEDEILDTMMRVEEETAKLPEQEQALAKGKQDLSKFEKSSQERVALLAAELATVQQQIKEIEATLPDDIRPQYERLVAAKGEEALSLVKERTCSACYTALTSQNYNDLLMGRLVICKACGRIVYLADE
jgi:hypothetical protein